MKKHAVFLLNERRSRYAASRGAGSRSFQPLCNIVLWPARFKNSTPGRAQYDRAQIRTTGNLFNDPDTGDFEHSIRPLSAPMFVARRIAQRPAATSQLLAFSNGDRNLRRFSGTGRWDPSLHKMTSSPKMRANSEPCPDRPDTAARFFSVSPRTTCATSWPWP